MNKEEFKLIGCMILAILLVGFIFWWTKAQWNEYLEMGMSELYCIQYILN